MKVIFVMPGGIEFIKEVGSTPPMNYRIAIPKELKVVEYDDETSLGESNTIHLVFEFSTKNMRYEFKYFA